jgi:hypothetical protein
VVKSRQIWDEKGPFFISPIQNLARFIRDKPETQNQDEAESDGVGPLPEIALFRLVNPTPQTQTLKPQTSNPKP